jgi:hypothetical protein
MLRAERHFSNKLQLVFVNCINRRTNRHSFVGGSRWSAPGPYSTFARGVALIFGDGATINCKIATWKI